MVPAVNPVTDPTLLAQLNGLKPVSDPNVLAMLNSDHPGEQPQPGVLEQLGHQLGLTGRYAMEGVGDLAGMFTDPIGQFLPGYEKTGEAASGLADKLGLPKPQGGLENAVGAASKALVGTGLSAGGAGAITGLEALAAQPGIQAASTMLGAGASDAARESGAGPGTQTAVGLAASLLPGAKAGLTGAAKGILRGGATPEDMARNAESFAVAGTQPSVGQATQGGISRGVESLLSKIPGGSGVMANKAKSQAADMGAKMNALADSLAPNSDPVAAGEAISKGIAGEGGFVARFKQKASDLYDKVDQFMPADTPVSMNSTRAFLAKATTPTKGAEATSALLTNPALKNIAGAIETDAAGGAMPYEAVKALRSKVGGMIADAGLTSDVPTGQLKKLYGSLSDDLRSATSQDPQAFAANNRAENYYRAGMDRIDKVNSVVQKNGGPEKIFQAAISGTREGASTLRAVMQGLKPDEAKIVTSSVIRRMGRSVPSAQNKVGDKFSTETFLSNWSGMSPYAKRTLFDRMGRDFSNNMDKVANVASNLREGSNVFRNPSGTAPAMAQITTATGLAASLMTGNVGGAALIGAGLGASNVFARAMTNPTFVKWLARNTTAPVGVLPAQIGYLMQIGQKNDDPDLVDAAKALNDQLQNQQ